MKISCATEVGMAWLLVLTLQGCATSRGRGPETGTEGTSNPVANIVKNYLERRIEDAQQISLVCSDPAHMPDAFDSFEGSVPNDFKKIRPGTFLGSRFGETSLLNTLGITSLLSSQLHKAVESLKTCEQLAAAELAHTCISPAGCDSALEKVLGQGGLAQLGCNANGKCDQKKLVEALSGQSEKFLPPLQAASLEELGRKLEQARGVFENQFKPTIKCTSQWYGSNCTDEMLVNLGKAGEQAVDSANSVLDFIRKAESMRDFFARKTGPGIAGVEAWESVAKKLQLSAGEAVSIRAAWQAQNVRACYEGALGEVAPLEDAFGRSRNIWGLLKSNQEAPAKNALLASELLQAQARLAAVQFAFNLVDSGLIDLQRSLERLENSSVIVQAISAFAGTTGFYDEIFKYVAKQAAVLLQRLGFTPDLVLEVTCDRLRSGNADPNRAGIRSAFFRALVKQLGIADTTSTVERMPNGDNPSVAQVDPFSDFDGGGGPGGPVDSQRSIVVEAAEVRWRAASHIHATGEAVDEYENRLAETYLHSPALQRLFDGAAGRSSSGVHPSQVVGGNTSVKEQQVESQADNAVRRDTHAGGLASLALDAESFRYRNETWLFLKRLEDLTSRLEQLEYVPREDVLALSHDIVTAIEEAHVAASKGGAIERERQQLCDRISFAVRDRGVGEAQCTPAGSFLFSSAK